MNLKKNYRYLLVISLCLIALGVLLRTLFDKEQDVFNDPIYKFLFNLPLGLVLFLTVIFAPITEEIAFRSWACKRKAWIWISFAVSTVYVLIINVYGGIIYSVLFLLIIFFLKDKPKLRLYSFLILSSITFASLHYGNLQPMSFFLSFPQYVGIGLFCSYLTLRFNLLTSIIAHALNNFVAIATLGLFFNSDKPINFEGKTYKATFTNTTMEWGNNSVKTNTLGRETISFKNTTLGSIAERLIGAYDTKTYWIKQNEILSFRNYDLLVKQKDTNSFIDYKSVIDDLCKYTDLKIDTIKEKREVYVLNVKDWDKIIDKGEDWESKDPLFKTSVFALCSELSRGTIASREETPTIIPQKGVSNNIVWVDFNRLYKQKTFEEKKNMLYSSHGITLTKKDTLVNVIRIREK
ncbi:MAG TPA: hypothetical protein DD434_00315 [Bacteroidales bacterium]|nr:hypothetical protein [Bacteroidales bacterium]